MSGLRLALPATSLGSAMTPSSSLLSRYIMHTDLCAPLHRGRIDGLPVGSPSLAVAAFLLCYEGSAGPRVKALNS